MLWTLITGLAAAVAAIVAIVISFLQWMTAQTKVALDIHASRYAVYMELREAVPSQPLPQSPSKPCTDADLRQFGFVTSLKAEAC